MTAISLREVSKSYATYRHSSDRLLEVVTRKPRHREFHALLSLSLDIAHGEVVGVVGKNGAGKSTLLKLIAGTLLPSSGTVTVNGRVSALLELGTGFHPEMSGRDSVYLAGAIGGLSRSDTDRRYDEIVEFAGVGPFMDQPIKTYSSGMLVRLAFAVATSVDPDVLIIDEALSVGDGAFARKSFDRIIAFKEAGKTILFCSHSSYQVEAICDRVLWLDQGQLQMDGEPAQVVAAYTQFLDMEASAQEPTATGAELEFTRAGTASENVTARISRVETFADDTAGSVLALESGCTNFSVRVHFQSVPTLPPPSVAVSFFGRDGRVIASAGSCNDGVELQRAADGKGQASVIFPEIPLLKGNYWVSVYLLCEQGVHLYDMAKSVAELSVTQKGLELGIAALPHTWSQPEREVRENLQQSTQHI
ncbi:MAG: ABC transporter ATP-binding protein [Gammaproteobacteria bacterium]